VFFSWLSSSEELREEGSTAIRLSGICLHSSSEGWRWASGERSSKLPVWNGWISSEILKDQNRLARCAGVDSPVQALRSLVQVVKSSVRNRQCVVIILLLCTNPASGMSADSFLRKVINILLSVEFTGSLQSRSKPSSEGAGRVKKLTDRWINHQ
jgi:hypothetical protein